MKMEILFVLYFKEIKFLIVLYYSFISILRNNHKIGNNVLSATIMKRLNFGTYLFILTIIPNPFILSYILDQSLFVLLQCIKFN